VSKYFTASGALAPRRAPDREALERRALEELAERRPPAHPIAADILRIFATPAFAPVRGNITDNGEELTVTIVMRARAASSPAAAIPELCTCNGRERAAFRERGLQSREPHSFHAPECPLKLVDAIEAQELEAAAPAPAGAFTPTPFIKLAVIGARLRELAATLPACNQARWTKERSGVSDCRCKAAVVFTHGNFRLTTRRGAEHVAALAEKYEHPKVRMRAELAAARRPAWLNLRRPKNGDELLAELERELA
jgi:hypothetical protein